MVWFSIPLLDKGVTWRAESCYYCCYRSFYVSCKWEMILRRQMATDTEMNG